MHLTQVAWVALDQRGRQQATGQQLLRAVHIGQHLLKQPHALQHAGFDLPPVLRLDDQREQFQRPRPLRATAVGVNVVGHAVVADLPGQLGAAAVQVAQPLVAEVVKETAPGLGQARQGGGQVARLAARGAAQFVEMLGGCGRRQAPASPAGLSPACASKREELGVSTGHTIVTPIGGPTTQKRLHRRSDATAAGPADSRRRRAMGVYAFMRLSGWWARGACRV